MPRTASSRTRSPRWPPRTPPGCDYVESDCHLTADGVVVLFHDDDLVPRDGRSAQVAERAPRRTRALMADRGGLITLAQALDAFPPLRFNLDVKAPAAAAPVGRLVAPHAERVLLTSFSDDRRREALDAAQGRGSRHPSGHLRRARRRSRACSARSRARSGRLRAPRARGRRRAAGARAARRRCASSRRASSRPRTGTASRCTCGPSTTPQTCAASSRWASTAS